jgi:hypothetical protein
MRTAIRASNVAYGYQPTDGQNARVPLRYTQTAPVGGIAATAGDMGRSC